LTAIEHTGQLTVQGVTKTVFVGHRDSERCHYTVARNSPNVDMHDFNIFPPRDLAVSKLLTTSPLKISLPF